MRAKQADKEAGGAVGLKALWRALYIRQLEIGEIIPRASKRVLVRPSTPSDGALGGHVRDSVQVLLPALARSTVSSAPIIERVNLVQLGHAGTRRASA
jgi:hypothetical protein